MGGRRSGVHFATSLRHGTAHGQEGRERELFIQEGNRAPMSKASTCIGLVDIRRWGRACLSSASLWGLCVHRGDVQQTRRWASGVAELHAFVSGQPPLRRDVGRSSGVCLGASRVGRCGQVTLNCISTRRLVVTSQKRRSKLPRPGAGRGGGIIHLLRGSPGAAMGSPRRVCSAGGLPERAGSRLPLPTDTSSAATQAGRGNLSTGSSKCGSTNQRYPCAPDRQGEREFFDRGGNRYSTPDVCVAREFCLQDPTQPGAAQAT